MAEKKGALQKAAVARRWMAVLAISVVLWRRLHDMNLPSAQMITVTDDWFHWHIAKFRSGTVHLYRSTVTQDDCHSTRAGLNCVGQMDGGS